MLKRERIGICTLCAPYAIRHRSGGAWLELVSDWKKTRKAVAGERTRTADLLIANLDGAAAQAEPGLVGGQRERPVDGDRSGFDGPRIVRGCGERARHRPAILVEVDRQRYSRSTIRPAVAVLLAEFPPARGHADPRKVQVALPTSVEPARDDPEAQRAARAGRRLGACRRLARRNRSPSPQSPTVRERAGRPLLMSPAAHGAGGRCVRQSHPRSEVVHRAGPTVRAVVTPLHRESRSPRRRSRPRVRHREPEMAVRSGDRSGGIASNWSLLLLWFTSGASVPTSPGLLDMTRSAQPSRSTSYTSGSASPSSSMSPDVAVDPQHGADRLGAHPRQA